MTQEEKARAYDEALKLARDYYKANLKLDKEDENLILEDIFPSLSLSEDERMMNQLHSWMKEFGGAEEYTEKVYNWLQGLIEKQGEQKPVDEVEPKFHEGDWIINKYMHFIMQILNNDNGSYETVDTDGIERNYSYGFMERNFKLWTIADAKDGDVLCCESGWTCIFKALYSDNNSFSSYCFMDSTGWFCETGSESHTLEKAFIEAYSGNIYPATKEQRDTLERAMTNAGYRWNKEELKLEKI